MKLGVTRGNVIDEGLRRYVRQSLILVKKGILGGTKARIAPMSAVFLPCGQMVGTEKKSPRGELNPGPDQP